MLSFLLDQLQDLPGSPLNLPLANSTLLEVEPTETPTTSTATTPDSDSDHIDDTVHLLKGRYGGTQLAYKGYLYTYDRTVPSTETKYWQCIVRKEFNPKCTARLISTSGNFPAIVREPNHVHPPSLDQVTKARLLSDLRADAVTAQDNAGCVVRRHIDVPDQIIPNIGSKESLKQVVRRKRRKTNQHPTSSSGIRNLIIPDHYKLYKATSDLVFLGNL